MKNLLSNWLTEGIGGSIQEHSGLPCNCKSGGDKLPDKTFEEAARLAAYYSSARDSKVEIDYTSVKT